MTETFPRQNEKKPILEISAETRRSLAELFQGAVMDGEKLPPVFLKLYSGMHGTEQDAAKIGELIDKADIYIPEGYEWNADKLARYNKFSRGERKPRTDASLLNFKNALHRTLYGKNKPVVFVDVPESVVEEYPERYEGVPDYTGQLLSGGYEEAANALLENIAEYSPRITANRESYMLEHFREKIEAVVRQNPELKKKEIIRVLMTLGEQHTALYHALSEIGGEKVEREFQNGGFVAGFIGEMSRRVDFHKNISEDLKKKALTEFVFNDVFFANIFAVCQNTGKNEIFLRIISEPWTEKERKEIFKDWKQWKEYGGEDLGLSLKKRLAEKSIRFPSDEKEMDEVLKAAHYDFYAKKQKNGEDN